MTARAADRTRYNRATAHLDAPIAIVDLEAFDANADDLVRRAAGKPVRVASKSVRCRALLERVLARPGFAGIMSYTLAESLWLARAGFDDVLLAYPSADRSAFAELAADPKLMRRRDRDGRRPRTAGADRRFPGGRAGGDPGLPGAGHLAADAGRPGPDRGASLAAAIPAQLAELARSVARRPGFRLVGLMAYEGHVAGVGDALAGRPLRSRAIRLMQSAARRELAVRRAEVVRAVRAVAPDLEFVNGGGTGSVQHTAAETAVTEIAAGSGLYVPRLFDNYTSFTGKPAACSRSRWCSRPGVGVVTVLGGGYPASGAVAPTARRCRICRRGCATTRRRARARCRRRCSAPRRRPADRRQGLVPARQGRGTVRALRRAAPDRGRPGHGERSDVQGRGADLPLTPARQETRGFRGRWTLPRHRSSHCRRAGGCPG